MAERIGLIRKNLKDGFAVVVTDRHGACTGCHTGGDSCRSCLSSAKIESRVTNPIGARTGDIVKISIKSADLFKSAALFYLLPVVCLIAGALISLWANQSSPIYETTRSTLGGLTGLVVGIGLAVLCGRSRYARTHLSPSITAVVTPGMGQSATRQSSCCS